MLPSLMKFEHSLSKKRSRSVSISILFPQFLLIGNLNNVLTFQKSFIILQKPRPVLQLNNAKMFSVLDKPLMCQIKKFSRK